jgi:hypothetical protein
MKHHTAHDGGRTIVRFDPKMGKKRATPSSSLSWCGVELNADFFTGGSLL